jgi:hypothetical protein
MKPTSEQTRNAVLSAVPLLSQDLLAMKILFGYGAAESPETRAAAHQPAAVDPSSSYGCVDWYLYPDSKVDDVAA